jgi:hypothetical protein
MKEKIGKSAGLAWKILKDKGEIDMARLPRMMNEKTIIVYQALGWLAREDKVQYRVKSGKTLISLTESEKSAN